MFNIEKSGFHKGEYIGYGGTGAGIWRIRKKGPAGPTAWVATRDSDDKPNRFTAPTLKAIGEKLAELDAYTKRNPKKRVAKKKAVKKTAKKKVAKKRTAKKPAQNPILRQRYAAYTVQDGVKYYLSHYDARRGIPVFDTDINNATLYRRPDVAIADAAWITKATLDPKRAKEMLPFKAEDIYNGRKTNPAPRASAINEAKKRFEDFTGMAASNLETVRLPKHEIGLKIGPCDGVLYTTVRDGKTEKYIHEFKKKSRPLLAASHDGKSLYLIGGSYTFTERGIEDH